MIINDPVMKTQHEAVRNTVGWYCFTHYLLQVTGADATALLDKIYVSSIAKTKVGRAKYTTMLNEDGIIIDDVIVFHIEENKYWISTLHLNNKLIPWLDDHKGESDVAYEDITGITEMYAIQGPKSKDMLNAILAENINDHKFFSIRDNKINDIPVKIARTGYSGELGYEIYVASENAGDVEAALAGCGKPFGAVEVTEFQVKVWSLPSEKGYNLMSDLRGTNPFEVGFEDSIDWSKDFIGKESLERLKEEGPKRQILGFIADDETVQIEGMNRGSFGAVVKINGEDAGRVTKYVYSYTFALVDRARAKVGDRVTISGYAATLTDRIWYDVENKRPFGK
jgi:aminomethyltransferase